MHQRVLQYAPGFNGVRIGSWRGPSSVGKPIGEPWLHFNFVRALTKCAWAQKGSLWGHTDLMVWCSGPDLGALGLRFDFVRALTKWVLAPSVPFESWRVLCLCLEADLGALGLNFLVVALTKCAWVQKRSHWLMKGLYFFCWDTDCGALGLHFNLVRARTQCTNLFWFNNFFLVR